MLSLFKKKTIHAEPAERAYAILLERTRDPVFYQTYGVPDSFDGRFDMLLVHVFALVGRLKSEGQAGLDFNQALFDRVFADMDQALREGGIGDMGVPKHMRRMMKAFNGRMHAYDEAIKNGDGEFAVALRRNLYGTLEDQEVPNTQLMVHYIKNMMASLARQSLEELLKGEIKLPPAEMKNVA